MMENDNYCLIKHVLILFQIFFFLFYSVAWAPKIFPPYTLLYSYMPLISVCCSCRKNFFGTTLLVPIFFLMKLKTNNTKTSLREMSDRGAAKTYGFMLFCYQEFVEPVVSYTRFYVRLIFVVEREM